MTAPQAAAETEAFLANPTTTFEQFAGLVTSQLDRWVIYPGHYPGQDPDYQIGVDAPGKTRAGDWWVRLALLDTVDAFDLRLHWWHHTWILRRAFAVADPAAWGHLYAQLSDEDYDGRGQRETLLGLVRSRTLATERAGLRYERDRDIEGLLRGWDDSWQWLRADVPARTTRENAQRRITAAFFGQLEQRHRLVDSEALRSVVLADYLYGQPPKPYGGSDQSLSVLSADDLVQLVRHSPPCVAQSEHTWVHDAEWLGDDSRPAAYTTVLGIAPLDVDLAARHLDCPAPLHRIALARNPLVPEDAGREAIRRGIAEADALIARSANGWPACDTLVRRWWQVLMAARGWHPRADVAAAMRQVAAWMLADRDPIKNWVRPLAVLASCPDGLCSMDDEQLAVFDALLADRAGKAPFRWRTARSWDPIADPHTPFMSPKVLRQLLAATGWADSLLLEDPAVAAVVPELPVDLRVQAARRGDDEALRSLVDDPEPRVRQHVARNRRASAATLDRLLDDADPSVRSQVARNAGVTGEHLARMSQDGDRRVARAASRLLLRHLAAG